jgi:AhpD family alkylhydroperoxidase
MRRFSLAVTLLLLLTLCPRNSTLAREKDSNGMAKALVSLSALDRLARSRVNTKARIELAEENSEVFKDIEGLALLGGGRVPNYLRSLATLPKAIKPLAHLVKTVLYAGDVAPETKLGMALRISQLHNSPYIAAHMKRLLRLSQGGRAMLDALDSPTLSPLAEREKIALSYAELLTDSVQGASDSEFQKVRGSYNDSQIVELTMTVCFFNYFTRLCEALSLPVEGWVLDTEQPKESSNVNKWSAPLARVSLMSDEEIRAAVIMDSAAKDQTSAGGLGLGIANSQRAMTRCPAIGAAWRNYGSAVREYSTVSRELKLHVSFAVSMANGCRYCTLHQVLGLRRLGVDPAKLVAMKKNDEALTQSERTAVVFARKLTSQPASISDKDYEELKAKFSDQGALEILLQTCAFNFMNRFTDGLRLPSEDEAIRVYKEVYGGNWQPK